MKVFDILPPASPRHGFHRTVSSWVDAALVEFGPEGTMNYAQMSIPGEYDNLFTTGMEESQIIFGDTDHLEACIREVDRQKQPKLLFVTSSPVSEIIGADLRFLCRGLQPEIRAKLTVWDSVPMEGTEEDGRSHAFRLAAEFVSTLPAAEKKGLLVLGLDQTDYNGISDLNELRRMAFDYFSLPCLNDAFGRYRLTDLTQAACILTVDPAAEPLAEAARRLWGTPWCSGLCYGLEQARETVSGLERCLGAAPSTRWQEDLESARRVRDRFLRLARNSRRCRIHLCQEPSRAGAMERLLTCLGLSCDLPQDPCHGTWGKSDILVGSGVLCGLFPDSPSFCVAYPGIRQYPIGEHCPYMGVQGEEILLAELSGILPTV